MLHDNISSLIGSTPLVRLNRFGAAQNAGAEILGKLEYLNPAGSVKDRVALSMLNAAEASGQLTPGGTIVEPTSGNTGVGLASLAAARGYKIILTMPETMSVERRSLLKAYGATLVLTDGKRGMTGAIEKAQAIAAETPNSFLPSQFTNPANPEAHRQTTGPEIWADTGGRIDAFVAGVGTGGTITGIGAYLKAQNPDIQIIAVEPSDSPVLSGGTPGAHGLQGIGAGFVPDILDTTLYDEVITITKEQAFEASRTFARTEGALVGISSGAALAAAVMLSQRAAFQGKTIVVLLPDNGERYLSTGLYD